MNLLRVHNGLVRPIHNHSGYTLIEVVVVLIVVGILAAVAMKSMTAIDETARVERTKQKLNRIATATVGDPNLVSGGVRTDYGYVGDIGALPNSWQDLYANPGLGTWDGPYLDDEFTDGNSDRYFTKDDWGATISRSGVNVISNGGATTLSRQLADSEDDLLRNSVHLVFTDLDGSPPGIDHLDSVTLSLTYPNGAGSLVVRSKAPNTDGSARFDSVPIGIHELRTIYAPSHDTLRRLVNVDPGQDYYATIQYYLNVWQADTSGGGGGAYAPNLEMVPGSDSLEWDCHGFRFWIFNNTGSTVAISSVTVDWTGDAEYYEEVEWNGSDMLSHHAHIYSEDEATFSSSQDIDQGDTVLIEIDDFKEHDHGHGHGHGNTHDEDVDHTTFTIEFSDGSTFTVTTGSCP